LNIISFINEKGGVGKTQTAVKLAYFLGQARRKVLLIDLDPQASATSIIGLGSRHVDNPHTFTSYDLFFDQFDPKKDICSKYGVDVIPADDRLARIDMNGAPVGRMHNLDQFFKKNKLDYDYVLIDCKGALGILTINALVASTHFVAVTQSQHLSIEGLGKLFKTINTIKSDLGIHPEILGILITMFNKHLTHEKKMLKKIQDDVFKSVLFKTVIRTNTCINMASQHGVPIGIYDNNSRGAIDYRNFCLEFIKRTKK